MGKLKYYAVNKAGRQLLYQVSDIYSAWEFVNSDSYWVNNPPKYITEVKEIKFYPEDFENEANT